MKHPISLLALLLGSLCGCHTMNSNPTAGNPPAQTAHHFHQERKQVLAADYLLYLPANYTAAPGTPAPLILFLHGAGERGTKVWQVAKHGVPKEDQLQTNFPFIVVSPQCPDGHIWSNEVLLALLDEIQANYNVDPKRVYLTGLSMGGFGTWSLGLSHPERFAAIAPICGGGEIITPLLADKSKLVNLPIWAFHGAKDPVVPVEESEHMVNYLKRIGAQDVQLTIYPEAQHDCWTQTYRNPDLFQWFLQHSR